MPVSDPVDRTKSTMAIEIKKKKEKYLPYAKIVLNVLNHLMELININLDYWQFLLNDMRDFSLVSSSCDDILKEACVFLTSYFIEKVNEEGVSFM